MTLNQLMLIVRARLHLVLLTLLTVVVMAMLTASLMPKSYLAQSKLIVDMRSADSVLGSTGVPLTSPSYMNTQGELVSSSRVIHQAIEQLKLEDNDDLKALWADSGETEQTFKTWLTNFIRAHLQVIPGKESNTVAIQVSTDSPEFSAVLANGLARAYIKTAIELNVEPAREYAQIFDRQLREARDDLIHAQSRLSEFQRERGLVVVSDERMDVESSRLNELSSALTQFQAQRADQASRAASSGDEALLQDPSNVMVLNSLRTQLKQKESQLAEASARIGENHPEYNRLKAEVVALQAAVKEEATRSNASLNASTRASYGREATIRKAVEEQRNKILKLKENRDAAMALQRDVDVAQKQFELVSTRTSMSEISSRQTTAHAHLVSEAIPPAHPSSPRWTLVALGSLVFGLVLGLTVACVTELLDRRVRSTDDLALTELPLLGLVSALPPPALSANGLGFGQINPLNRVRQVQ
ncbi:MAG: GNVR domain-containing protein [Limnobacter sp.]|uniref:GNVR domain-containing protein n=1 Tax=Limnobacter sp. TaxID=2003368 RepID=UPI00391B3861